MAWDDDDPELDQEWEKLVQEQEFAGSVLGREIGLLSKTIEDLGEDQREAQRDLSLSLKTFRGDFVQARRALEQEKDEEKKKKLVKDFQDNVKAAAATLPGVAKGVLAIVDGVKKDNGTAIAVGVLDIVGSVTAALGPYGAAVSSVLSMVSIVLNAFAPKPDNLVTQLANLMRVLAAENKLGELKGDLDAIKTFAIVSAQYMQVDEKGNLKDPQPVRLKNELKDVNPTEGPTVISLRSMRDWLATAGNQELDEWPELLKFLCDAYLHLSLAFTRLTAYTTNRGYIEQYVGKPEDEERKKEWKTLVDILDPKVKSWDVEKSNFKAFLKDIAPVVRKRGVYVVIAFDSFADGARTIMATTGPGAFSGGGTFKKVRKNTGRMSIVPPWRGVSGPDAKYDVWVLDNHVPRPLTYDKLGLRSLRYDISNYIIDGAGPGINDTLGVFVDLWPMPGTGADGKFTVYLAGKNEPILYRYEWDQNSNNWNQAGWKLNTGPKMTQVRLVGSVETFDGDRQRGKLPAKVKPGGTGVSIIYGTLEDSKEIFVAYTDAKGESDSGRVPILPASYNGIAVDQRLLWVYGREGFQCATHASVIDALNTGGTPLWLGHGHPNQNETGDTKTLSSCEDGTLLFSTPSVLAQFRYGIDFDKAATSPRDGLVLADKCEALGGVRWAYEAQKLPIYCWSQFRSLANTLSVPVDAVS